MRKALSCAAVLPLFSGISLIAQQIRADYSESRSTDVYVAQCFANGGASLTGNQALLAWQMQEGLWDGVARISPASATALQPWRLLQRNSRRCILAEGSW